MRLKNQPIVIPLAAVEFTCIDWELECLCGEEEGISNGVASEARFVTCFCFALHGRPVFSMIHWTIT